MAHSSIYQVVRLANVNVRYDGSGDRRVDSEIADKEGNKWGYRRGVERKERRCEKEL